MAKTIPEATANQRELYIIERWDELFESPKSRGYNNKSFCQMPNKHNLGYRRLVKRSNGGELFGAWCALVQLMSRHPKPRHGWLTDDGTPDGSPYTPDDLECLTDIKAKHFVAMLKIASSEAVGWLTLTNSVVPYGPHTDPTVLPQGPLDSDGDSDNDAAKVCLYGEFKKVKLDGEQYAKLLDSYGDQLEQAIDILDTYIAQKGDKYKNHAAVMKRGGWVWERVEMSRSSRPTAAINARGGVVV